MVVRKSDCHKLLENFSVRTVPNGTGAHPRGVGGGPARPPHPEIEIKKRNTFCPHGNITRFERVALLPESATEIC